MRHPEPTHTLYIDADSGPIVRAQYPLGTKVFLVLTDHKVYYFRISDFKLLRRSVISKDKFFVKQMQGTDLFLIQYEKEGENTINLEAFANVMPDKEMCHRSCGPDCEYNFKPCSHVLTIVTVFIVILTISFCFGIGYIAYLAKLRANEEKVLAEEFHEVG